ncbi:alpha/beta hydrolase [Actinospica sp. MGRD01-02]|uniref:Alpha/beta hydrolase n=1 Tax=Actinospica acidithermotolerans TaxID=2828514 RepID=A0A941E350_9ACTN|nr:alpha/beta hydrolase [Actinospica acidithermotolerans]MBR7825320.1 alpha/beta hydrolase [Actinospica acidithermotolerans]
MAQASGKGRRAGILGAAVGVVAAGAALGFTVERLTIGRAVRRMAEIHDPGEPFGTLRGDPQSVTASDGVELYVEVDEPRGWAAGPARTSGPGALNGTPVAPPAVSADRPTLLFTHGFCLPQDCWHYQRAEFSATHRMVFWDQRGHGRSERPPKDRKGRAKPVTIDQLGEDLHAVLQATCPQGPVILVGHSMGGMTMMALAQRHPELFGERIVGTALISTSAGRFQDIAFGLPRPSAKLLHRTTPAVLELLAKQTGLVERGRAIGGDFGLVIIRRYAFGSEVPESLVRYTEDLIQSTPIDVIADFYPVFGKLDMSEALPVFDRVPSLVLGGANDLILPVAHSEALADAMPSADYVVLPNAGHALILEHPDAVGNALRNLVDRAEDQLGSPSSRRAAQ